MVTSLSRGTRRSLACGVMLAAVAAGLCSVLAGVDVQTALAAESTASSAAPANAPAPQTPRRESPVGWNQTYVGWSFQALGFGYSCVFLALFFSLLAIFTVNVMTANRDNVVPVALVESFESHLNGRRYRAAYEAAQQDESALGQVLSAGLAKLSAGYAQALEAMRQAGEEESMKFDHRLSYMALIGTISPMVGLFGTIHGMISSFSVISCCGGQPRPSDLAEGISTALFTTLLGLFIAIPAIASYNLLRNRIYRLIQELGILSEGLMSRFAHLDAK